MLVYDIGGGTLDTSLLDSQRSVESRPALFRGRPRLYMSGTAVTVLGPGARGFCGGARSFANQGVAGDDHLGGSDFDLRSHLDFVRPVRCSRLNQQS